MQQCHKGYWDGTEMCRYVVLMPAMEILAVQTSYNQIIVFIHLLLPHQSLSFFGTHMHAKLQGSTEATEGHYKMPSVHDLFSSRGMTPLNKQVWPPPLKSPPVSSKNG